MTNEKRIKRLIQIDKEKAAIKLLLENKDNRAVFLTTLRIKFMELCSEDERLVKEMVEVMA